MLFCGVFQAWGQRLCNKPSILSAVHLRFLGFLYGSLISFIWVDWYLSAFLKAHFCGEQKPLNCTCSYLWITNVSSTDAAAVSSICVCVCGSVTNMLVSHPRFIAPLPFLRWNIYDPWPFVIPCSLINPRRHISLRITIIHLGMLSKDGLSLLSIMCGSMTVFFFRTKTSSLLLILYTNSNLD